MKKFFFTLTLVFTLIYSQAQDTIVAWTFPDNSADSVADAGTIANQNMIILTAGGTSVIEFKNGATTKAAQATAWDNGIDSKCWMVSFISMGYENLLLSSKQSSGGNDPGPRDFKVQYSVDGMITWSDVSGTSLTVANDWTTGVVNNVSLPASCNNQILVFLRWVMTSDTASDGNLVIPSGKSKIDDIVVMGTSINSGVNENDPEQKYMVYPNPASNYIFINGEIENCQIEIMNKLGMPVLKMVCGNSKDQIDISTLAKGNYYIRINDHKNAVIKVVSFMKI